MGEVIHAAERFRVPHTPNINRGERTTYACIDERLALFDGFSRVHNGATLIDRRGAPASALRYRRTAGGAVGLGQDTHIALRMQQARHFGAPGLQGIHQAGAVLLGKSGEDQVFSMFESRRPKAPAEAHLLGSIAVKTARSEGIDIVTHEDCAAEINAALIAQGIASGLGPQGEDLFEAIRYSYDAPGGLKKSRYNQIADMYGAALADNSIASLDIAKPAYDQGIAGNPPTPRVALMSIDHYANTHIIEWGRGVVYDTQAAVNASDFENTGAGRLYGAYQTSMGDMPELQDAISSVFPVDQQDFTDAAFVRNAVTTLYLPRQHGDMPVQHLRNAG